MKPYPEDYTETTIVAKVELEQQARPELSETVKGMGPYDLIFVGYPN